LRLKKLLADKHRQLQFILYQESRLLAGMNNCQLYSI
jgi:hypothetical protein